MFEKKFPWTKVAISFVIGAAAGAATALLLTPFTGKKMQKKVVNAFDDQFENVEKIVKKVVNA